ncbi:MAG TPA: sugar phosphate isomerase/epimerase [Firmicutes bacterium]|jgi:sugar phosphate isomerase/epimerase|nr:sugar phosphate isomerase/epimerase [Bacillota bacterium]
MLTPCIWTDFLTELEPEDAIRMIGEAGFQQVEFGSGHEKNFLEGKEDEGKRLKRIVHAAERAGVSIVQMHGRLCNFMDENAEENIAWAHRSMERAAMLGVRWVVFHPAQSPGYGTSLEEWEYTRVRNVEIFRAFLKTAERVGVGIAIENMLGHRPRFGAPASDLLWLLDQLKSDRVGICWDTGHANVSNVKQGQAIRAINKRLVALHIDDNDGSSDQHLMPLRGRIDWDDVLTALREIDYHGPFDLELPGERKVTPHAARPAQLRYLYQLSRVMLAPGFKVAQETKAG